jgi:hypothetical protein
MISYLFCFVVVSLQGEYGRSNRHNINAAFEEFLRKNFLFQVYFSDEKYASLELGNSGNRRGERERLPLPYPTNCATSLRKSLSLSEETKAPPNRKADREISLPEERDPNDAGYRVMRSTGPTKSQSVLAHQRV